RHVENGVCKGAETCERGGPAGKDPSGNGLPIYGGPRRRLDGVRLHRRMDQYACFAFLASLVLAAPKSATYSWTSPKLKWDYQRPRRTKVIRGPTIAILGDGTSRLRVWRQAR
ncbi:MAG: hypothetical protein R6U98_09565, partial [Pirellulaceae bacterium]